MKKTLIFLTGLVMCLVFISNPVFAQEVEWDKTFGGSSWDEAYSVQQTSDNGYIIAGYTKSFGVGEEDVWLIKINSQGQKQWDKTFGGPNSDYAYSVQQTSDNGYVIAGYTESFGAGGKDAWLIKTDSQGEKQWHKTFGALNWDEAYSVQQTFDNGYIIAGYTKSHGAWLIKISGTLTSVESCESNIPHSFALHQNFPNPFNPLTEIRFDVPEQSLVTLEVFNVLGQRVVTLIDNEQLPLGSCQTTWNANNLSSGVYFYSLRTEHFTDTKRMVLVR